MVSQMESVSLSQLADEIAERDECLNERYYYEELDELECELDDNFFGYAYEAFVPEGND